VADAIVVLTLLAVAHVAIGWSLGFHSITAYLACWLLTASATIAAWRLVRSAFPWTGLADATIRAGVVIYASCVLAGLALGSAGLLGMLPYLCLSAAGLAASFALPRPHDAVRSSLPTIPIPIAAFLLPALLFIVVVGVTQSPLTLYDSLSYHLVFPARWLQEHRLSIVPTPFSDPAQAYQPGNGELFFLSLMLPFHGDLLARVGQLPFLILGGVSLYALAVRSGAKHEHAVYAPFFWVLARPVVEQAVGADVDLIFAAVFAAALYLGLAALETNETRDWLLWGVSLGLFLGTKYLALVYVGVLLIVPLLRGIEPRALWALPGIVVFGLPWYVRNWVIAGSPIFPASLTVLGATLARGAYTRAAMNNSVFHVTSPSLLAPIAAHAFGPPSLLIWLPFAALGAACLAMRRRWWPGGFVLLVPVLMIPLFWFEVPDNADARFLLPAVTIAMVPLAFPFGANRRWNACLHVAYVAAAAWLVVGMPAELPMALPRFMRGWLSMAGIVSPESLGLFAACAFAAACLASAVSRRVAHAVPALVAALAAGCVALTAGASPLLAISSISLRTPMVVAWQWVSANVANASIAYTGNNLPYPLFGDQLSNRVFYVNIDRQTSWRFHDYARARRGRLSAPGEGLLARPSGQLMAAREGHSEEMSRPRFERWEGYREAWVQNLRSTGAEYLFVTALSAYEVDYVWHNSGEFPIEDDWARIDTQDLTLVYENSQVRIYKLTRP
jgi:hypothetical protein